MACLNTHSQLVAQCNPPLSADLGRARSAAVCSCAGAPHAVNVCGRNWRMFIPTLIMNGIESFLLNNGI